MYNNKNEIKTRNSIVKVHAIGTTSWLVNGSFAGNLFIVNVQKFDAGTYLCRADSSVGQSPTKVIAVEVLGETRLVTRGHSFSIAFMCKWAPKQSRQRPAGPCHEMANFDKRSSPGALLWISWWKKINYSCIPSFLSSSFICSFWMCWWPTLSLWFKSCCGLGHWLF